MSVNVLLYWGRVSSRNEDNVGFFMRSFSSYAKDPRKPPILPNLVEIALPRTPTYLRITLASVSSISEIDTAYRVCRAWWLYLQANPFQPLE